MTSRRKILHLAMLFTATMIAVTPEVFAHATAPEIEVISRDGFLPDSHTKFTLEEIKNLPAVNWQPVKSNYGFSDRALYLRSIIKVTSADQVEFTAALDQPFPDVSEFWVLDGTQVISHTLTGAAVPYKEWTSTRPYAGADFHVKGQKTLVIYSRIEHTSRLAVDMNFLKTADILVRSSRSNFVYFMFLGAILILLLHNFAMYFATREHVFVAYSYFIFIMLFSLSSVWGVLSPFIAMNAPQLSVYVRVSHASTTLVIVNMCLAFLERKSLSAWVNKMVNYFLAITWVVVAMCFFEGTISMTISGILSIVMVFVCYTLTINCLLRGHRHGYFMLMALSGPTVAFVLNHVLLKLGLDAPLKENITAGFLFEGATMSIAMSERVRRIKIQLLDTLSHQKETLEKLVEERTAVIKSQQGKLLTAARGEAVTNLSLGVSHEINNPLAIAQGYLFALKKKINNSALENKGTYSEQMQVIQDSINRIAIIVKSLRDIAELNKDSYVTRIDAGELDSMLHDAIKIASEKHGVKTSIQWTHAGEQILCDKTMLGQVLNALVINAADAVLDKENAFIEIKGETKGDIVEIKVTDNAGKIPEDVVKNMFDPFFTTRSPTNHKGLGLTTAKIMCESTGARLRYASEFTNTTFIIDLPLARADEQKPADTLNIEHPRAS